MKGTLFLSRFEEDAFALPFAFVEENTNSVDVQVENGFNVIFQ